MRRLFYGFFCMLLCITCCLVLYDASGEEDLLLSTVEKENRDQCHWWRVIFPTILNTEESVEEIIFYSSIYEFFRNIFL